MKKVTKLLSVVLTLAMIISALPVIAGAAPASADNEPIYANYNKTIWSKDFDGTTSVSGFVNPTTGWISGYDATIHAAPKNGIVNATEVGIENEDNHDEVLKVEQLAPTSEDTSTHKAYNTYVRINYGVGKSFTESYLPNNIAKVQRGHLSFDMYLPEETFTGNVSIGARSNVTTDAEGTPVASDKSGLLVQFIEATDKIMVKTTTSADNWVVAGNIIFDAWNTFDIYVDSVYGSYDVYMNGELLAAGCVLGSNLTGRAIDSFHWDGGSTKLGWKFYLDNMKYDIVDETHDFVISRLDFENYTKADGTELVEDDELYSHSTTTNKTNVVDGIFEVFNITASGEDGTTSTTTYTTLPTAKIVYKDGGKRLGLYGVGSNEFVSIVGDAFKANNPYYQKYGVMPTNLKLSFEMRVMSSPIYFAIKSHGNTTTSRDFFAYGGTSSLLSFNATTKVTNTVTWPTATNNWRKFDIYLNMPDNTMDVYCQDTYMGSYKTSYLNQGFECLGFKTNKAKASDGNKILAYLDNITLSVPGVYVDENIHEYLVPVHAENTTDETGAITAAGAITGSDYKLGFAANIPVETTETFTILAAEYDAAGNLASVSMDDYEIEGAGAGVYEIALPEGAASKNCQYFFWKDATDSLKPLFAPKKLVK